MDYSRARDWARALTDLGGSGIPDDICSRYLNGRDRGMSHEDAVLYVRRLAAIARRWDSSHRLCSDCGTPVMWRREPRAGWANRTALVPLEQEGLRHLCRQPTAQRRRTP